MEKTAKQDNVLISTDYPALVMYQPGNPFPLETLAYLSPKAHKLINFTDPETA